MSYLDKLLEGVEVEWRTLGEVIKLEKGKQLNKELLSEDGLYPAYNGGITFSGFTNIYNYNENTIIISQGGASAGFVNFITTKFYAKAARKQFEDTTNKNVVTSKNAKALTNKKWN